MGRRKIGAFTELSHFTVHPPSVQLLPLVFSERRRVVVLGEIDIGATDAIHVGMLDPQDTATIHLLHERWMREIIPVHLTDWEISIALDEGYGGRGDLGDGHIVDSNKPGVVHDSPVPDLIDDLLLRAVATGASDIHVECYPRDVDVRFRIDGVLHQLPTPISPSNVAEVVSRIKVLAKLNIAEHRVPQDGRFRIVVTDGMRRDRVDFRVSTLPGPGGEDAVLRVLNAKTGLLPIEKLGMLPDHADTFERIIKNPEGAVFVTGPTGSGKTTTLYSALTRVNDGRRKILTAEDPIEYQLDKVNQKQVGPNLTMARLARTFLRQDPDVILVGEVRDAETAVMVNKAAATGHLVLTTLHTGDSFGVVPRLETLGLERDQIAENLLAAVSQRLVRRICPDCAEEAKPSPEAARVLSTLIRGQRFQKGRGCEHCYDTGYRGRTGLYEILVVDEALQDAISHGESITSLRLQAREQGFRTLVEDGLSKARDGLTSLDEILRVLPYRQIKGVLKELA